MGDCLLKQVQVDSRSEAQERLPCGSGAKPGKNDMPQVEFVVCNAYHVGDNDRRNMYRLSGVTWRRFTRCEIVHKVVYTRPPNKTPVCVRTLRGVYSRRWSPGRRPSFYYRTGHEVYRIPCRGLNLGSSRPDLPRSRQARPGQASR